MGFRGLNNEQRAFVRSLLPRGYALADLGPRAEDGKSLRGILYLFAPGRCRMERPREHGFREMAWRCLERRQEQRQTTGRGGSRCRQLSPAQVEQGARLGDGQGLASMGGICRAARTYSLPPGVDGRSAVGASSPGSSRMALCHERLLSTFTAFIYLACFIITEDF